MAIAFVQAQSVEGSSTTATTPAMTTTTGNLIVACVNEGHVGEAATPMTDSKSNTWTKIGSIAQVTGVNPPGGSMYYSVLTTGGASHTFTYHGNSAPDCTLVVFEFSGCDSVSPLDGGSNATQTQAAGVASGGHGTSAALTNTAPNAVYVVCMGTNGDNGATNTLAFSAATGGGTWTIPTNGSQTSTNNLPGGAAYQIVSSSASRSVQCAPGSSGTEQVVMGIASFAQAGGAAASTLPQWLNDLPRFWMEWDA